MTTENMMQSLAIILWGTGIGVFIVFYLDLTPYRSVFVLTAISTGIGLSIGRLVGGQK